MYWIVGVKFVDLRDSCAVGGDPAIIAWVPVLNAPEQLGWRMISCFVHSGSISHQEEGYMLIPNLADDLPHTWIADFQLCG